MAVESDNSVAVDSSAAVQMSSPNVPFGAKHHVTIVNTGVNTIYVGGTDAVTSDDGFAFAADGTLSGELEPGEELWGRCATAETSTFSYLHTGV